MKAKTWFHSLGQRAGVAGQSISDGRMQRADWPEFSRRAWASGWMQGNAQFTRRTNTVFEPGYLEGDDCKRNGCDGVIEERKVENCYCHLCTPCGNCTEAREYCPECGWEAKDEVEYHVPEATKPETAEMWRKFYEPKPLDPTRLDYRCKPHTNSSMIKEGVFPFGMGTEAILEQVNGTFGGRFQMFDAGTPSTHGRFSFIAYTD